MSNPLHKFFHEIFIADFKDYKHKVVTVPADEGVEKAVSVSIIKLNIRLSLKVAFTGFLNLISLEIRSNILF
jgi:hypothetical protein